MQAHEKRTIRIQVFFTVPFAHQIASLLVKAKYSNNFLACTSETSDWNRTCQLQWIAMKYIEQHIRCCSSARKHTSMSFGVFHCRTLYLTMYLSQIDAVFPRALMYINTHTHNMGAIYRGLFSFLLWQQRAYPIVQKILTLGNIIWMTFKFTYFRFFSILFCQWVWITIFQQTLANAHKHTQHICIVVV